MSSKVILTMTDGPLKGQRFVLEEYDILIVGRAEDCHLCLTHEDMKASRHHCILEISPPHVRIRDLGSAHGTYVNGTKYGARKKGESPKEGAKHRYREVDLQSGDEIRIGNKHVMQVQIEFEQTIASASPTGADATELETTAPWPPPSADRTLEETPAVVSSANPPNFSPALAALLKDLRVSSLSQVPELALYVIERQLGQGAFGSVYLASNRQTGEQVALKVMRAKVAVDEKMRQRFQREIEITKDLHHPNVVALREHGSLGQAFYFTMEYCTGGNLRELMKEYGGKIPLQEAIPIMRKILEGLAYLHQKGYIHRDLKPQNILIVRQGQNIYVMIGDLGLAKNFIQAGLSGMTVTGTHIGTRPFMPREQLYDYKYNQPPTDVWSIGATFYLMLTGHYPRPIPPNRDWVQVVLRDKAIPIRTRNNKIPQAVAQVIDQALQMDTQKRYKTAGHMLKALNDALGQS